MANRIKNVVYVIGEMDLSRIGPVEKEIVKIGKADDLDHRLAEFRTAHHNPLAVLTTYPGAEDLEKALHTWFESRRYHRPEDRRHEREWFDFRDIDPLPLIDHAVAVIRLHGLEWKSEKEREALMLQASRSTRLAEQHLRHLGTEFSRVRTMGEQVHAEASRVLDFGFTPRTQTDGELKDLVFKEHVYLLNLLAERLEWHTADLKSMIRRADRVLTREDAKTATGLDRNAFAQIKDKWPQALAARWREPVAKDDLKDLLGFLSRPAE
ncbi:GIY-YIG nuclease family protein [Streptomyces cavourensis]